ncbi:MAG TPA: site-specific DNA-methyltransferase, partial [Candidatus Absconditabacterales bacterium]|nr:site-specific DNA-methyltransferase [Candidatus Absconditabacterales bacterium]
MQLQIQLFPIDKIIPYEFNNKIHPEEQINKIANSIQECGFRAPILIDENNIILAGHGRLLGAQKLGLTEVPVIQYTDLDELQKKKYRILDNKLSDLAERDIENLKIELEAIDDPDLNLLFDDLNLGLDEDLDVDEDKEDEAPEVSEKIWVEKGDIFQLGEHRLLCGDATKLDEVQKLMDGELCDLVITDPPYNVNYEGSNGLKIQNDNMGDSDFYQFLYDVYTNLCMVQKDGGSIYVFHADTEGENFRKAMVNAGYKLSQCLVRVKNALVMGRQDYHRKHEPILYGWKKNGSHNWYSDRSQTTVWNFDKPLKNDVHPTMKPIDILVYPISNSSKKGELVVDLFGGSGSTMIACEKTFRKCNMMELDERYVQVIIQR